MDIEANGNKIVLSDYGIRVYLSYGTPVAMERDGVRYKTNKKYSSTTSRHINDWGFSEAEEVSASELFEEVSKLYHIAGHDVAYQESLPRLHKYF